MQLGEDLRQLQAALPSAVRAWDLELPSQVCEVPTVFLATFTLISKINCEWPSYDRASGKFVAIKARCFFYFALLMQSTRPCHNVTRMLQGLAIL
jgi:hypothetical protein